MDKRKAQRERRRARESKTEAGLQERIATAIKAGRNPDALRGQFSEAILKRVFCRFAIEDPALLDIVFGKPPHDFQILIDECVDPALLPELHRNFGRAVPSYLLYGKSVQDDALFGKAAAQGFTAIVTCDGVSAGTRDLCGIARRAYEGGAAHAPHIILVPQKTDDALAALRKNAAAVRDVLKADKGRILNLDPAYKAGVALG